MSRGHRRGNWKKWGVAGIVLFVFLSTGTIVLGYQELIRRGDALENAEQQLASYRKVLYVAAEPLVKGMILSEENVRQEVRYTDQHLEEFISTEAFGMEMTEDIPEGTCLSHSMVTSAKDDVKEVFVTDIELAEHLENGCRIDVRIRFPNAEDYVVLSDKVANLNSSRTGVVLKLTEEEILYFSAAVADCFQYERTRLYAVKYPEYQQMAAERINYIPNQEVLDMLGLDVKQKEDRQALENRLECGAYD